MPAAGHIPPMEPAGRRRLDPVELALLGVLVALALARLAAILWRANRLGWSWTGSDSVYVADGMQYISWARESGEHVGMSDRWRIEDTAAAFVHPGLVVSGAITRLGIPAWLAYMLWKPVGVVILFAAVRAYVHRMCPGTAARRAALALALFVITPMAYLAPRLGQNPLEQLRLNLMRDDMWPIAWTWGYPFVAIAVASLAAGLLLYERDRRADRVRWRTPALGIVAAWLQPWQGSTLIALLVVGEALVWLHGRGAGTPALAPPPSPAGRRLLLATVAAAALPLCYYALLGRLDPSWAHAESVSRTHGWPVWWLLVALAPLALPAALAYRSRIATFGDLTLRMWPLFAAGLFYFLQYVPVGTFSTHALQGVTVPLAVLAVTGIASLRIPLTWGRAVLATGAVLVLTVPLTYVMLRDVRHETRGPLTSYIVRADERDALRHLDESAAEGGVLARQYLSVLVPATTGRHTYAGHAAWTPDYFNRIAAAQRLFAGDMGPAEARRLVRRSGARFLLTDCETSPRLESEVAPLIQARRRFGCAAVLELTGFEDETARLR